MDEIVYNCKGENITGKRIELLSSDFGYVDEHNIPHIKWGVEDATCDADGFDKTYCLNNCGKKYIIEDFVIPAGTIICRYGTSAGTFTTLKGADYEKLGLPYKVDTIEYHEYKVSEDLNVTCYVDKGVVAPKFFSMGGEVQFKHKQSIFSECVDGYLQEVRLWIQKSI